MCINLSSIILTFVLLRAWLSVYPNTDLNVGEYNIHHIFTGLLLIMVGGVPLALFRGSTYKLDIAALIFGALEMIFNLLNSEKIQQASVAAQAAEIRRLMQSTCNEKIEMAGLGANLANNRFYTKRGLPSSIY